MDSTVPHQSQATPDVPAFRSLPEQDHANSNHYPHSYSRSRTHPYPLPPCLPNLSSFSPLTPRHLHDLPPPILLLQQVQIDTILIWATPCASNVRKKIRMSQSLAAEIPRASLE